MPTHLYAFHYIHGLTHSQYDEGLLVFVLVCPFPFTSRKKVDKQNSAACTMMNAVLQELKNWGSYTYNKNIGVCIVLRHANAAV